MALLPDASREDESVLSDTEAVRNAVVQLTDEGFTLPCLEKAETESVLGMKLTGEYFSLINDQATDSIWLSRDVLTAIVQQSADELRIARTELNRCAVASPASDAAS